MSFEKRNLIYIKVKLQGRIPVVESGGAWKEGVRAMEGGCGSHSLPREARNPRYYREYIDPESFYNGL